MGGLFQTVRTCSAVCVCVTFFSSLCVRFHSVWGMRRDEREGETPGRDEEKKADERRRACAQ